MKPATEDARQVRTESGEGSRVEVQDDADNGDVWVAGQRAGEMDREVGRCEGALPYQVVVAMTLIVYFEVNAPVVGPVVCIALKQEVVRAAVDVGTSKTADEGVVVSVG